MPRARRFCQTVPKVRPVSSATSASGSLPSPNGRWHVGFSDDRARLDRFLKARQRGCFYVTLTKRQASLTELPKDLGQQFPPAKKSGLPLAYGAILDHCERL